MHSAYSTLLVSSTVGQHGYARSYPATLQFGYYGDGA